MKKLAAILLLTTFPAQAQQTSTAIDRVAVTLGQCVSKAESFVDQITELRTDLAKAQAKIKELEDAKEKGK